ncbi:MAG: NAD-dependent deacetylase [Bacteroidota bacterium]|jgi:NAD-dependent deacetylase
MKKLVVITGAGMSAESGISTFRDSNGLWENHDIMEVASPLGWKKNPELVLDFYNKRRAQLREVTPNKGHFLLAELEQYFDVQIITQNVDNLHERAGSTKIIHLHGELTKVRGEFSINESIFWEKDITIGDVNEKDEQLRPDIVWFGEAVSKFDEAVQLSARADFMLVIGTSLQVYPAASLIEYPKANVPIIYIDPNPAMDVVDKKRVHVMSMNASEGLELVKQNFIDKI